MVVSSAGKAMQHQQTWATQVGPQIICVPPCNIKTTDLISCTVHKNYSHQKVPPLKFVFSINYHPFDVLFISFVEDMVKCHEQLCLVLSKWHRDQQQLRPTWPSRCPTPRHWTWVETIRFFIWLKQQPPLGTVGNVTVFFQKNAPLEQLGPKIGTRVDI